MTIGVGSTDVEKRQWFEYELSGRQPLTLKAAVDPRSLVVFVAAEAERDLEVRLGAAAELMGTYRLVRSP